MMCQHKLALINQAKERWPAEPLYPCGSEVSLRNCFRLYKVNGHYEVKLYYNLRNQATYMSSITVKRFPACCDLVPEDLD